MMAHSTVENSTRDRSTSTGDSDLAKHDRKRPRLDITPDTKFSSSREGSADLEKSQNQTIALSSGHQQVPRPRTPPLSPPLVDPRQATISPTSRMTINTRPMSSQSNTGDLRPPHNDAQIVLDEISVNQDAITSNVDSHISATTTVAGAPLNSATHPESGLFDDPISILSSRSASPDSAAGVEQSQPTSDEPAWLDFPFRGSGTLEDVIDLVKSIAQNFEKNEDPEQLKNLLRRLTNWLLLLSNTVAGRSAASIQEDVGFYQTLPLLLLGLLRRRIPIPLGVTESDLLNFVRSFANVALSMIQADVSRLRALDVSLGVPSSSWLLSPEYLQRLTTALQLTSSCSLYTALRTSRHIDCADFASHLTSAILQDELQKPFRILSSLFDELSRAIPPNSPLRTSMMSVVTYYRHILTALNSHKVPLNSQERDSLRKGTSVFVLKAYASLQEAIKKQHSWLNIDNTSDCVNIYVYLTKITIILFPELATEVFKMARIEIDTVESEDAVEHAVLAFKLALHKILIQHGRMELRVWATETMAQELVNAWTSIQRVAPERSQPVTKLVVDFLSNNEIVGYILGVDSHPQIITRSFNVIGFLCVSNNWHNQDTDVAWCAILEAHDHRSVAAVLDVLKVNLQHLSLDPLLYFYGKLRTVPADKFDNRMLEFTSTLLNLTAQKHGRSHDHERQINPTVVELCLHLLTESHVPSRCATEISGQIREEIGNFLLVNPTSPTRSWYLDMMESERDETWNTICRSVASHDDRATGSIIGMRTVLYSLDKLAASELVAKSNFTNLLLDDMVDLLHKSQNGSAGSGDSLFIQYASRVDCMFHLICQIPQSIDQDMQRSLWIHVLTASLPSRIRSYAWSMIAKAYRLATAPNPVLEFVASHLTQDLPPSSFDMAVLDFAQASVEHDVRINVGRVGEADQCLETPAMERLWWIMLEAPEQTVEAQASDFIIKSYLDKALLIRSSHTSVEKSQEVLVDRCIRIVIESAQKLTIVNEPLDEDSAQAEGHTVSDHQVNSHEVRLHRSLMLLRSYLEGLKNRPQLKMAPSQVMGPALRAFQKRGNLLHVKLRILDHPDIKSDTVTWTVGEDNVGHELWQLLTSITGWSQINFITSGARTQLHESQSTLRDLKVGAAAAIVNKAMGATEIGMNRTARSTSPVDTKIMDHFSELYDLLESPHEGIAKAIYEFLTIFSSQENIVSDIKSRTLPAATLLPVEKPFKLLYYASALRSCIEEESFSSEPNVDFLQYAVQSIVTTLSHVRSIRARPQLFVAILHGIIETLLLALRAKVPEAASNLYFVSLASFVDDLLQSWHAVLEVEIDYANISDRRALSRNFLDVMIESSLHEPESWHYIGTQERLPDLLASSILLDPDQDYRCSVRDVLLRLTGTSANKTTPKTEDVRSPRGRFPLSTVERCLQNLWIHLSPLLCRACEASSTCTEFLEVAVAIFGIVSKLLGESELLSCFTMTKTLLLQRSCTESDRMTINEGLPLGLARILYHCILSLGRGNVAVPDEDVLVRDIFRLLLFPALSDPSDASLTAQKVPILNSNTRTALYDVLVALCKSQHLLGIVAEEIADSAVDRDAFIHQASNERKALRSDQGYAGLRNLSNTCYLNSLVSQLFMNVKFREFVIGIDVANENSQNLVVELANVFANMQSSYEKYANPEEAVESITQYTGEQIDVTVQMDVDEFFNLLFDRLEAQIKDADARKVFKSIYGGQLVQQIKSQECEHVSERLEPFSAVQIEIKGKSGLEEGLAAYVEGEILQGENKYSCTGCGKLVNAVKRACLKEVPDNLIFNLKRFDYDIMTGMRCKVNDEFQFPDKIDMMPYTMDALSDANAKHGPDMFELVGVIIHSGTAETGHYYSYIRQRPSSRLSEDSWVQFNDHEVSKFDPKQMKDLAFGGCDQSYNSMPKWYNGYMLFYQRSSSVDAYAQDYPIYNETNQVQVSLPRMIDSRIAQENEICFRRYVAQDASHARFVRQILERVRTDENECSNDHILEDNFVLTVLEYISQVSSRWKEAPEFEETIKILTRYAKSCPKCAFNIMDWFNSDENVVSCLLRAWYTQSRKHFAALLSTCYAVLSPLRHSSKAEDGQPTSHRLRLDEAFTGCLTKVSQSWSQIQRYNRGWESLFGFVLSVSQLGSAEAHALIELGFLERCLEIIWIHQAPNSKVTPKQIRTKYSAYLLAREKGRQFNHTSVMQLFAELLSYVSLDDHRLTITKPAMMLSAEESDLLGLSRNGSFTWLKKLIAGRNSEKAIEAVIQELCNYPAYQENVQDVLLGGLLATKNVQTAFLFLEPCRVFVQCCSEENFVTELVKRSLVANDSDGSLSGSFLDYIKSLHAVETTVSGITHQDIEDLILSGIGSWAPPLLMAPNDIHRDVRVEALTFVDSIFFTPLREFGEVDDVRSSDHHMDIIRNIVLESSNYINKTFVPVSVGSQQQHRETLFMGQSRQILQILEHCAQYFSTDNAEDEQVFTIIQNAIDELNVLESSIDTEEIDGWREQSSDQLSDQSYDMSVTP